MRLGPFRGALARDASTHSDGATMRVGAWAWGKEKDNKLGRKEICINLLGISCRVLILFAIKNLLNGERFWRRPALRAGRRPTKYHRLAFRNSLHRVGISQRTPSQRGQDTKGEAFHFTW
jgi:hypothetical protein